MTSGLESSGIEHPSSPSFEPSPVAGLLISTILHVILIIVLAAITMATRHESEDSIPATWSEVLQEEAIEDDWEATVPVHFQAESAGGAAALAGVVRPRPAGVVVQLASDPGELAVAETWGDSGSLGESVQALSSAGRQSGQGTGDRDGDGSGTGFFGADRSAQSIVFVVDCSSSMNQPHESTAKTRFRRVKIEMLRTIAEMDGSRQFFIVFFNNEALPMPAGSLQYATPHHKQRYLEWMARIPALGETDPREALGLALRLSPQVIYFLTDGRFTYRAEQELLGLRQTRSRIHTFVFGESEDLEEAAALMQKIAENNGGEYHFIP